MPTVTEIPTKAYAACTNVHECDNIEQELVDAHIQIVEHTFVDYNGSSGLPGVESSREYVRFNVDDDGVPIGGTCPSCGSGRDITLQKRPRYRNESGVSPLKLIEKVGYEQLKAAQMMAEAMGRMTDQQGIVPPHADQAAILARLEALEARNSELEAEIGQKANKPGPKPREA